MNGVAKVVDLVEEISIASKEQASGLDQVTSGLGQIDQVTQSNTASAEECASASEELASQAEQLATMVKQFKLTSGNTLSIENKLDTQVKMISDKMSAKDVINLNEDDFGKF